MFNKIIISTIASLVIVLTITSEEAKTQTTHEMPTTEKVQTSQFQKIDQPLWVKAAVTTGGLGLIGLEMWWFLFSKPKSQKAETNQGFQEVTIIVDQGYEPSSVVVNVDQPVRLNFLRQDTSSCLEQVVFPDFHIAKTLELNKITSVEFTPKKTGQYTFTCGMNMFRGVVEAKAIQLSSEKN